MAQERLIGNIKGKDAVQPTITIGSIEYIDSDAQPQVTNTGSNTALILNFKLPKPKDGVDGVDGVTPDAVAGPKGDKGDRGIAATITIGEVTTGEPGTDVIITNVGTTSDAVLDITIPRGDQGEKGDGSDIVLDDALSEDSTNGVENQAITRALNNKPSMTINEATNSVTFTAGEQEVSVSLTGNTPDSSGVFYIGYDETRRSIYVRDGSNYQYIPLEGVVFEEDLQNQPSALDVDTTYYEHTDGIIANSRMTVSIDVSRENLEPVGIVGAQITDGGYDLYIVSWYVSGDNAMIVVANLGENDYDSFNCVVDVLYSSSNNTEEPEGD